MGLTWPDVTKILGGALQVTKTWFIRFHNHFHTDKATLPSETSNDGRKSNNWPDLWRHKWASAKISQYIRNMHAQVYQILVSDQESVQQFVK